MDSNDAVVDLPTLEDVARLAQRYGSVVLFNEEPPHANYMVRDNGVIYRYRRLMSSQAIGETTREIQEELVRAIDEQEFVLYYQPSVSLISGRITRVEALLRWKHPQRGLLMPMQFLPQAEQVGMIDWIDEWVLRDGCRQMRNWMAQGQGDFPLAINISAGQLRRPGLPVMVRNLLAEYEVPADQLCIELHEDQLTMDAPLLQNLRALRQLGLTISIDSPRGESLNEVAELAGVSQVKFGRDMVRQVTAGDRSSQSMREWIHLAHEKKLNIIAVGVETTEQLGFLRLNACDEVQGYLVSPPLPADELTHSLQSGQRWLNPEDGGTNG